MKSLSRGPSPRIITRVPDDLLEELRNDHARSNRTWSEYLRMVLSAGARAVREAGVL